MPQSLRGIADGLWDGEVESGLREGLEGEGNDEGAEGVGSGLGMLEGCDAVGETVGDEVVGDTTGDIDGKLAEGRADITSSSQKVIPSGATSSTAGESSSAPQQSSF